MMKSFHYSSLPNVLGDKNPISHSYGDDHDCSKEDILRKHAIFFTSKPYKCDFPASKALKVNYYSSLEK
jgi:hypothetical protein